MSERRSNRRDEKLEAHGIRRKEWVARAIALAGMHGTGARRASGKSQAAKKGAPGADDADDPSESGQE
jgi:hypothetical protein